MYIFSGSKVIAEYDNGAAVGSPSREYIYSGGALLAKIDSTGTKYYHQDHLSNRVVTDSSGNTLAQMGHYPFGESWYNASSDKLLFTSYERDAESGNDYAMVRFHVNRLGRFSSPDPLSGSKSKPQSLNKYSYVLNDPPNSVDPLGRSGGPRYYYYCGDGMGCGDGGGCSLDGISTPCSIVTSLMGAGAALQCPNNDCSGLFARQGPGGTTNWQQWVPQNTWATGDDVSGYVIHVVIAHWEIVGTTSDLFGSYWAFAGPPNWIPKGGPPSSGPYYMPKPTPPAEIPGPKGGPGIDWEPGPGNNPLSWRWVMYWLGELANDVADSVDPIIMITDPSGCTNGKDMMGFPCGPPA